MKRLDEITGEVFNVGGGRPISVSLRELTRLCEEATGNRLAIEPVAEERSGNVRVYLSDCRKVKERTGWVPVVTPEKIVGEIVAWINDHRAELEPVLLELA